MLLALNSMLPPSSSASRVLSRHLVRLLVGADEEQHQAEHGPERDRGRDTGQHALPRDRLALARALRGRARRGRGAAVGPLGWRPFAVPAPPFRAARRLLPRRRASNRSCSRRFSRRLRNPARGAVNPVFGLVGGHRLLGRRPGGFRRVASWRPSIVPDLAAGRRQLRSVIGVDIGGTKLLAGVVDEQLEVHARAHRTVRGKPRRRSSTPSSTRSTSCASRCPTWKRSAFGIPCLIDQRSGVAVIAVNLDIAGLPVPRHDGRAARPAGVLDNDANVMTLAEQRFGAARGATTWSG